MQQLYNNQEKSIAEEFKRVMDTVNASSKYEDMHPFADTCKSWLWVFICMRPLDPHNMPGQSFFESDSAMLETEPLTPKSRDLREKVTRLYRNIKNDVFFVACSVSETNMFKFKSDLTI